jgi:hypothetical protein
MAQIKSYDTLSNVKEHVKRGRILSSGPLLTVAADSNGKEAIKVTASYHQIKMADGAAIGGVGAGTYLKNISSETTPQAGQVLVLRGSAGSYIFLKNTTGANENLYLNASTVTLNGASDTATLMWTGSEWCMLASSIGTTPS